MPRFAPIQTNFSGGEFSPLMYGSVDAPRYKTGLAVCLNYVPTLQGALQRRTGTKFAAEVKDSTRPARLQSFVFSTVQAYMLEFGANYIRFYKNRGLITLPPVAITNMLLTGTLTITAPSHGLSVNDRVLIKGVIGIAQANNIEFQVTVVGDVNTITVLPIIGGLPTLGVSYSGAYISGGTVSKIYEVATLYADTDLFQLKFSQSDDVLFVAHPSYAPVAISRTAHTNWTVSAVTFVDGPYLDPNSTTTTLANGATSSPTTLTASSIVGINNDLGFQAGDLGRLIRVLDGTNWQVCLITGVISTTVVTVTFPFAFAATTTYLKWRLGLWSATSGYPAAVTFHEDRLVFGGTPGSGQRIDASNLGDYYNFAPSGLSSSGVVSAGNAYSAKLNSNDVNQIRSMISDEKGLLPLTVGGEWFCRSPSGASLDPLPGDISAKQSTRFGSADIQAIKVGRASLFVQRAGKKLRELTYNFYEDGFDAADLTLLSEHITGPGLVQLCFQNQPQCIVYGVRSDGVMTAMIYDRDMQSVRAGWARIILGGALDAAGSPAKIESAAVIPSSDGSYDELWILVRRWINGQSHLYAECLSQPFTDLVAQTDAVFVDASLTYDQPIAITAVDTGHPLTITAPAHGFSNGDTIRITGVLGLDVVNNRTLTVQSATTNTFSVAEIPGPMGQTYVSGGKARKLVSTISGLTHLEGQTVSMLGDGAVLAPVLVTAGTVLLSTPCSVVQIGLSYTSQGQQLRLDGGAADGTGIGKTRRTNRLNLLLHRTLGLKVGTSFDALDDVVFRTGADLMSEAVPLFNGIVSTTIEADYDFDNQICWQQTDPLPGMILAVCPMVDVQDR